MSNDSTVLITNAGAEDALVAATHKADAERRRDLVQMVSHDIKTHLSVILGFVGLLRSIELDESDATDALDRIESNAREAAGLTINFLRAEEVDSQGLALHATESSLNEVVRDVVRNAEPRARLRGVSVQLDVDSQIPAFPIDVLMLGRALANLVDNAIHHSTRGQTVQVETHCRGDGVTVAVRDRGAGIPAEQVPHLFERFGRGDRPAHAASTGLGLYIVGKVIDLHGGSITVTRRRHGGTTFKIFLPRDPA